MIVDKIKSSIPSEKIDYEYRIKTNCEEEYFIDINISISNPYIYSQGPIENKILKKDYIDINITEIAIT
jgi:hypothetical protein